jgi:hypothetical protein
MAIDKIIKSNRLLQSRRYTVASLTDAQEAFTSVLDINSKEIYAQANLLPTSSLPFSGSSQNGSIYAVGGQNLLRYWHQHVLTPSNVVSASLVDAWFFIDPSGSSVTPQIIQSGQQTNFISNKYASPSLTNADAQDNPPGYNIVVLIDDVKQNSANYQFDYKNGVLQFNIAAPTPLQTVKVTAYQYVGQTVDTVLANFSSSIANLTSSIANLSQNKIVEGTVTASVSSGSNSFTLTSGSNTLFTVKNNGEAIISGSLNVTNGITGSLLGTSSFANNATSASYALTASFALNGGGGSPFPFTGSAQITGSLVVTGSLDVTNGITGSLLGTSSFANNATSASFATNAANVTSASFATVVGGISSNITNNTDNRILTATGGGSINGESNLTFDGSILTVTGDTVITNNLTVQGTASFQHTTNKEIADRFILFASGSNTAGDGGIVVQQNIQNVGELFGFDSNTTRWAFTSSFNAADSNFTPDAFVTATVIGTGTVPTAAPARYQANGNIFIGTDETIWIYS